ATAPQVGTVLGRLRAWDRRKMAVAGAGLVVALGVVVIISASAARRRAPPAEAEAKTPSEEPEEAPGSAETAPSRGAAGKGARTASGPADNRKLLEDAERLLRAERFPEARAIFSKLAKSRKDRGMALVGLAEIPFQEKKYAEAVQSAERAAADRGGGVRARVLL